MNRRDGLRLIGGVSTSLISGCTGFVERGYSNSESTDHNRENDSESVSTTTTAPDSTSTRSPEATQSPENRVTLDSGSNDIREYDEVRVLPGNLRNWLDTAATSNRTIRKKGDSLRGGDHYREPVIDDLNETTLKFGDTIGRYEGRIESGRFKPLIVWLEKIKDNGAEATNISDLHGKERGFLREILTQDEYIMRGRVEPQTEIADWLRNEGFGLVIEYRDNKYKITKKENTSHNHTRVWYIINLNENSSAEGTVLNISEVSEKTREALTKARAQATPVVLDTVPGDLQYLADNNVPIATHRGIIFANINRYH